MSKFQVEFYENVNGEIPVEDFIKSLDKKMRAKQYRDDYMTRYKNE